MAKETTTKKAPVKKATTKKATTKKAPAKKAKIEAPKTIEVRMTESYSTWVVHESVEITVADYPELEGMTEEEMTDYIMSNSYDMKATNSEWYDSLHDELVGMDVVRDKITNEESEIVVEGFN
jgi:1,2-phenylacetyl-CoA epoxidase PaaB subunit